MGYVTSTVAVATDEDWVIPHKANVQNTAAMERVLNVYERPRDQSSLGRQRARSAGGPQALPAQAVGTPVP